MERDKKHPGFSWGRSLPCSFTLLSKIRSFAVNAWLQKLGWEVIRAGHKYAWWPSVPCRRGHLGTRHLLVQKYSCSLSDLQLNVITSLSGRALADVQQLNGFCSLHQPPKQPKGKQSSLQHGGSAGTAAEPSLRGWSGPGSSSDPTPLIPHPLDGDPCPFQGKSCLSFSSSCALWQKKNVVEMPYPDEFILNFCKLSKFQQDEEHETNPEHRGYFSITGFPACQDPKHRPCALTAAPRSRQCNTQTCVSPFSLP